MTWSRGERLYSRLPEIYRRRDREQGEPLRTLLALAESQLEAVEDDIAALYESWFIETCEDWAVPYLGDLLGVQVLGELPHAGAHPRTQVAQALAYRERKGTPAVLERVARDIAGWPARAVEMFERLGHAQDTGHVRPGQGGTFDVRRGAAALAAAESPFAPPSVFRTVDVRRIGSLRGRFNLPSLGLHLWRLQGFPVQGSPAAAADGTGGAGFRFDPLGGDIPLFNRLAPAAGTIRQAAETDLPVPITLDALDRDLQRPVSGFYGPGRAIRVMKGGTEVPASAVVARDLDAWEGGVPPFPGIPADGVAIDPERGRLLFATPPAGEVRVDYAYGFAAAMGGGPYDRRATLADPAGLQVIEVAQDGRPDTEESLTDAFSAWSSGDAVIRILDNGLYEEDLQITVPRGVRLALEAADGARPVLRPPSRPRITGSAGAGEPGTLAVNGLLLDGGLDLSVAAGAALGLEIAHSTLVPRPGRASLGFLAGGDASGLTVRISSSIVGGLQLPVDIASLEITDSILDAATGTGGAAPLPVLVSGALPPDAQWPLPLGVTLEMTAAIGASAPKVVRLRRAPADLEEARVVLQEALRAASAEDRFTRATVLRLGDRLLVRSGVPGETVALSAGPADPATAAALRLTAPPAVPLHGLLSGSLETFPGEPASRVAVTLAGDGPHTVTLAPWDDAAEAAQSLEAALHGAGSTPVFLGAQVDVLPGATAAADRLLVRPGTAGAAVAITGLPLEPDAFAALGLDAASITAPEGTNVEGVFSGLLLPFPGFPGSALSVAFGGAARTVPFAGAAAALDQAAATLQSSLRAAAPADPAFGQAQVLELGDRLLVIPGAAPLAAPPVIAGTAGDPETVRELALGTPPAENVFGLVSSGPVSVPLWTEPALRVRLGGAEQLPPLTLARVPQNAGEAAEILQAALVAAGVAGAEVLLLADPPPLPPAPPAPPAPPVERLLVRARAGASWVTVAFSNEGADTTATELKLTVPPGRALQGLLSGAIGAFPDFTLPSLEATFGRGTAARSQEIELDGYPRDLATLGALLEEALRAAIVPPAADSGFEGARVYVLPDGVVAGRGRLLVISGEAGGESVAFKKTETDPNTATDAGLAATLAQEARPLLSGSLTPFPAELLGAMRVTVGALGPRQLSLGGLPGTLDRAVEMLRSGLRFYAEPAYRDGDAVRLGDRLLVVSGALGSQVTIDNAPGSSLATDLRLTAAAGARRLQGRLSGVLSAFPALPRARLQVRLGSANPFQTVELVDLPATVGEAAAELQTRLGLATGGGAAFTAASVLLHGTRLLLLPGAAVDRVTVAAAAGAGEAPTAGDLLLLPVQSAPALASGDLSAFTGLQRPEVRATFGATSATAVLGSSLPADLATARAALETALIGAGFTGTQVTTTLDQRLLVLAATGTATPSFATTAGDPYTAADLALTAAGGGAVYEILRSAPLSPFPALTAPVEVEVHFGALDGTADLGAPPASLAAARSALEAAIRAIDPSEPAFRDARVLVLGTRLLVVPGVAGVTVSIQEVAGSTAATDLGLTTAAGATGLAGLLSGSLAAFPSPLRIAPAVLFRLDGTPLAVSNLATVPATLADARSLLATAFQAVVPPGVTATVEIVGGRLLLRTGSHLVTAEDVAGRPASATALRLPAAVESLQALLSGDLAAFTGLTVNPRIRVEIAGAAGTGRFARVPLDLAAARTLLEGAIRNAGGTPTFVNAVAEILDNRLLATAGQAAETIRFDNAATGPAMATSLALSDALSFLGRTLDGRLSGTGIVLPDLSFNATFGGSTVAVTLDQVPADLALLAPALQAGLRAAAPGVPTFAQAGVFVLGDQLLVLPGQPRDPVLFTPPSPANPDLVALLRLGAGNATTVVGLLSGALNEPLRLKIAPIFQAKLGAAGPVEAALASAPEDLGEAAALLQAALRAASTTATFTGATVEVLGDRLLVTAGAPSDAVALTDLSGGGSAPIAALRLTEGLATPATGALSGDLHTFPRLAAGPRFQARLGALTLTAYLADLPAGAEEYRAALEAALRTAGALHNASLPPGGSETAFSLARVRRLGDRFLVQPGDRGGLPVVLTDGSPAALAAPLVSGIALDGLLSGDLSAFSGVSATRPKVGVALGAEGPHTVELEAVPADLAELRTFFERALRAADTSETYRRARVQSTGGRLLITPGEPANAVTFTTVDGREADLAALRLDPESVVPAGALLTGPVQALSVAAPRLRVRLGTQGPHAVELARYPADLADAAALLQNALRAFTADSHFAAATVTVRGDRLHIASGTLKGSEISVAPVETPAPADPSSAGRFRLDAASAEPADGLLSDSLSAFPQIGGELVVDVTIGGEGPHAARLPFIPFTPEEARASLEQAVRSAHASPAFTRARVLLGQDDPGAADPGRRLVLLPGRSGQVEVRPNPGSPATAPGLRLTVATGARRVDALVSGLLPPLLALRPAPAVGVTLGSGGTVLQFDAAFSPSNSSLAAVAAALQEAIQGGAATPAARRLALVLLVGPDADNPERLAVIPGEDGYAVALSAAATDAATVSDLRLEIGSAAGTAFSAEEAGPPMTLVRSTVFGRLVLRELPFASETLFTEPVRVERRHVGCVRYCYLPEGSRTPRRFRCQPDLAIARAVRETLEALARARGLASVADLPPADAAQVEILQSARMQAALTPRHTSTRWGHPGYGQLHRDAAREISTGAEDGSEIGAFQHLHEPKRRRQLALLLEEYLRFGLDAGLFFLT